jgi:hypothetical protein
MLLTIDPHIRITMNDELKHGDITERLKILYTNFESTGKYLRQRLLSAIKKLRKQG